MSRPLPTPSDIPLHGWSPYADIHRERIRAHELHDAKGGSRERRHWNNPSWLPVLTEELGEVARELNEYDLGNISRELLRSNLDKELVQLAAMASAWLDALRNPPPPCHAFHTFAITCPDCAEAGT